MNAVEQRAFDARLTMTELCGLARIAPSTWSRARSRGTIRPRTLKAMEDALAAHEAKVQGETAR
jgi:hypothetical protein